MRAGTAFRRARAVNLRAHAVGGLAALGALGVWGVGSPPVEGRSDPWWEAAIAYDEALRRVLTTAFTLGIGTLLLTSCAIAILFEWGRSGGGSPAPLPRSAGTTRAVIFAGGYLSAWWFMHTVVPAMFGPVGTLDLDLGSFTVRPAVAAWYGGTGITLAMLVPSTAWVVTDPQAALGIAPGPRQPPERGLPPGSTPGG